MKQAIENLLLNIKNKLTTLDSKKDILELRNQIIGQNGEFYQIISQFNNETNKKIIKTSKKELLNFFNNAISNIKDHKDLTLPGRNFNIGHLHPITIMIKKFENFFLNIGFEVIDATEIEDIKYNFDLLLVNEQHPSRSETDTFYLNINKILRSHTSNVQARVFEKISYKSPQAFISFGKVYRRDSEDASHTPVFHQIEIVCLEEKSSFGKLKFLIYEMAKHLFKNREIRLRHCYFPFTEPTVEVDISCPVCTNGCKTCKNSGWVELMGCGMIHKDILENFPHTANMEGFAAGIGIERLLLNEFGMDDIRNFYKNDLKILRQFYERF